jgi:hypothetical protein
MGACLLPAAALLGFVLIIGGSANNRDGSTIAGAILLGSAAIAGRGGGPKASQD